MQIDAVTLSDLEVLSSSDGSSGLLGMVDRTSTERGRAALKRRLAHPSSELDEIVATQDAVRFFGGHGALLAAHESEVAALDRYLASNVEISAPAARWRERVESAWFTIRYPDVRKELRFAVRQTQAFFDGLSRTCESIRRRNPPALVTDLLEKIQTAGDLVLSERGSAGSVLSVDRYYRSEIRDDVGAALVALAELDSLASMGTFASSVQWVFPTLIDSGDFRLEVEDAFHPFLPSAVRNPIALSGGDPMVFLTGPNMAGKTTYLRTAALVVLLAQAGLPVPATRARLTPVDAIFTSINPTDDLRAGLSYFLAEVRRVRAAAELLVSGKRSLVLFDEVFKGTNVKDALEASSQVILGFARAKNSGFIFSSHLAELAESLRHERAIRFARFDGEILGGAPRYSYRLQDGVSEKRFGLLLLRREGIPELLERLG